MANAKIYLPEKYTSVLSVGDRFECDGFYYEIVSGKITHEFYLNKKSSNFKVQQIRWTEKSTTLKARNKDPNSKESIYCTEYELMKVGTSHKFVPFKRTYTLYPFTKAELFIEWDKKDERDQLLEQFSQ